MNRLIVVGALSCLAALAGCTQEQRADWQQDRIEAQEERAQNPACSPKAIAEDVSIIQASNAQPVYNSPPPANGPDFEGYAANTARLSSPETAAGNVAALNLTDCGQ